MCQAFCKVAMYASNSHRPFHHIAIDESFPSTSLQIQNNLVQISFNIAHTFPDSSSCFSRQLTRCTSTVRLGTSYLAQKQTKTQPTSDSTTPPRVKPLPTYNITSSLLFLEKTRAPLLHRPSSSPSSSVLQSYVTSCRFVQSLTDPFLCMSSYDPYHPSIPKTSV